jgi:hypothetical protein
MAPDDHGSTGDRPEPPSDPADEAQDWLLDKVRAALRLERPVELLGLASGALSIVAHPAPAEVERYGRNRQRITEGLVLRYVDLDTHESLAFAQAVVALVADPEQRASLRAPLDGSDEHLPGWLVHLDDAVLEQAVLVDEVFEDDEWLVFGVRLADGHRFSFRAEVDHDADGAIVDVMLMTITVDEIVERIRGQAPEGEVTFTDLAPVDAATRFREAVALSDAMAEPPRTETWPSCRPLVEWALRLADDEPGPAAAR